MRFPSSKKPGEFPRACPGALQPGSNALGRIQELTRDHAKPRDQSCACTWVPASRRNTVRLQRRPGTDPGSGEPGPSEPASGESGYVEPASIKPASVESGSRDRTTGAAGLAVL